MGPSSPKEAEQHQRTSCTFALGPKEAFCSLLWLPWLYLAPFSFGSSACTLPALLQRTGCAAALWAPAAPAKVEQRQATFASFAVFAAAIARFRFRSHHLCFCRNTLAASGATAIAAAKRAAATASRIGPAIARLAATPASPVSNLLLPCFAHSCCFACCELNSK